MNVISQVVDDYIKGILAMSPNLIKLSGYPVLMRDDIHQYKQNHVTLISGGGMFQMRFVTMAARH